MPDKPRLSREQIAQRAALELPDGAYVNLGWGIPNLIAEYVPKSVEVYFHSENGILGMGRRAKPGEEDYDLVDAMKVPVTLIPGASFDPRWPSRCCRARRFSGLGKRRPRQLENPRR
jgi:3-oxoacid CoA-transferase B subunit